MTVNFCLHPILRNLCLPVSRQELLSEILELKLYGPVTHIWHHPGHIFITTDEGRKLFTFDCKPVDHDHVFGTVCLDIASIPSGVVDICLAADSIALVIAANGHVQCWKFSKQYDWSHLGNFELCLSSDSSVNSVTYLNASDKIVWCEQQKKNSASASDDDLSIYDYCIRYKQFSSDLQKVNGSLTYQLMYHCPPSVVKAMAADFLFIQSQWREEQVTVAVTGDVDQEKVSIFLGKEKYPVSKSSSITGIDFSSTVSSHIPTLLKCQTGTGNLGVKKCTGENKVASLSSDGFAEVFSLVKGKDQVHKSSFQLQLSDLLCDIKHWFLCPRHIGIIQNQTLFLCSSQDGTLKHQWESEDLADIHIVLSSSSPSFLTWVLTDKGFFSLQQSDTKSALPYSSPDHLPHNHLLQTDILHLAYLHQLRLAGYDKDVLNKLQELQKAWTEGKASHQVQIAEKLEPLIGEYMRLENMSKSLKDSKKMTLKAPVTDSVDDLIHQEMASCKTASKVERHSKLLWLSNVYPEQLLNHLTKGVTLDAEEVHTEEMLEWQTLLDLDGQDLLKFEIVCRLLFVLHPEKLVRFVQHSETVSEHKIGVSAFMRKKHSLIYYKRACDCLPPAELSRKPAVAGLALAQLILSCNESVSEERALKYLLSQGLWSEAVSLLRTQCRDKQNLPCYLFITVSALANNQVLSEFLPDIFEIMPSWRSFLTCAKLAMERPEIREQQLSLATSDVFQQHSTDVSITNIKATFLKLLADMNNVDNAESTKS